MKSVFKFRRCQKEHMKWRLHRGALACEPHRILDAVREKGMVVDRRVEDRFIDFHFGKQDLTLKVKHGNGEQTLDSCIGARRGAVDRACRCLRLHLALFTRNVCVCVNVCINVNVKHCVHGDADVNAEKMMHKHSFASPLPQCWNWCWLWNKTQTLRVNEPFILTSMSMSAWIWHAMASQFKCIEFCGAC